MLRTTIALACAIVVLFSAVTSFAQETGTPENMQNESAVSEDLSPYPIEILSSPSDTVPGDFVVGPGKVELTIAQGSAKTTEIIVSNRTGIEREFQLVVEDATGSEDPEQPIVLLGSDRGPYTLRDYISFPAERFILKHNERARIPVTVSVPPDAEAGGRYGSVLVTTVSKEANIDAVDGATPSSAIISRVGTLFFLTIPGETAIEGQMQQFATVPDTQFFADGPINFQILFENTGNLHLNPYGEIRITNLFNEEVGFVEIDPWFALPQSLRSREISWTRELLLGRYSATAHINRGYDDIVDTETITFWVLPWKILVPIFVGLFLVFFVIRFVAKNFEFKRKST